MRRCRCIVRYCCQLAKKSKEEEDFCDLAGLAPEVDTQGT